MFVWTDLTWIDHAQWHNFMKISYPYGGTINFKICLDVQLTTHQPPMPNSSQTSAWSHRYIGRGSGKTEIPLLDPERISKDWMAEIFPWQKWSISYLWEHFLVPEHRIPIWLGFILGLSMEFLIFHYTHARKWISVQMRFKVPRFINQWDHPK